MRPFHWLAGIAVVVGWSAANAGPPYQTDDPEPTELGHWEIYNFLTADGLGGNIDGATGVDLNYGAAKGLQLTATLPIAIAREKDSRWRAALGDVELGAKFRFIDDDESGWQAAVFPRIVLPTAAKGLGGKRARLLLPLWVQKDIGKTSVFGGGGYEINPGSVNRSFWLAGLALTHDIDRKLSVGAELSWQSPDTRGGDASIGMNAGLIRKVGGPFAILIAGGPNLSGTEVGYHSYVALSVNF